MTSNTNTFSHYIRILGKGKTGSRSLTQAEAYDAFTALLKGEVEDVQVGAFLMLLRVKEESAEEIAGFVQACKDFIQAPQSIAIDIDWSSYAGKRKHLPWFIGTLLLLTGSGYRIFIHAAKGHTLDRLYTEEAFAQLGLPIAHSWQDVQQQLDQYNLSLLPLSTLCKPLDRLIQLRELLGLRTPVHTLCRLMNPLNAPYSYQSIFHPAYADTHQQAALLLKQANMAVFKGEGGEIERKSNATCLVKSIKDHQVVEEKWPRPLAESEDIIETLDMTHFIHVWQGISQDSYGENAIVGTLAIILRNLQSHPSMEAAQAAAYTLWLNRNKSLLSQ